MSSLETQEKETEEGKKTSPPVWTAPLWECGTPRMEMVCGQNPRCVPLARSPGLPK